MAIRHIVLFRLTNEASTDPTDTIKLIQSEIESLNGRIPGLQEVRVHANDCGGTENFQVALIATFDDESALDNYQVHPAHKAAIARTGHLMSERSAIDFHL